LFADGAEERLASMGKDALARRIIAAVAGRLARSAR
jgi:hypothetical protein